MTRTRTELSVAVVVVYAALGVAIGMVFWALLIHSGGDGDRNAGQGGDTPLRLDQQKSDERQQPREGDGG